MSRLVSRTPAYPEVMTAVYRLYDAPGGLLYVGVAEDFDARFRQHAHDKPWWPDVRHRDVIWFACRLDALAEEAKAIESEQPLHNRRRGHSRIGLMVVQRPPSHIEGYDPFRLGLKVRAATSRLPACPVRPRIEFNERSCRALVRDFGSGPVETAIVRDGELVAMAIPWARFLDYAEALGEMPNPERMNVVAAEHLERRERAPNTVSARLERVLADMGV